MPGENDERDQIIDSLLASVNTLEVRLSNMEYAMGMNPHGSQSLVSEIVQGLDSRITTLETNWLG